MVHKSTNNKLIYIGNNPIAYIARPYIPLLPKFVAEDRVLLRHPTPHRQERDTQDAENRNEDGPRKLDAPDAALAHPRAGRGVPQYHAEEGQRAARVAWVPHDAVRARRDEAVVLEDADVEREVAPHLAVREPAERGTQQQCECAERGGWREEDPARGICGGRH